MTPSLAILRAANLVLLALYPLAWTSPLARTGFWPFFDGDAITVLGGVSQLARTDLLLAALVAVFGIVLPYVKTAMLAAVQFGRLGPRALPMLELMGKLSMADVFLIAVVIVAAKGVGVGSIETAWGLYLFAGCILASLAISLLTARELASRPV